MDELNVNQMQTERKPGVNVALLAKWMRILFWLIIISTAANLLTSENVTNAAPPLASAGQILNIAANVAYGVVLLKIASESMNYRNSAICRFITVAVAIAVIPISDNTESFIAIPVVILSIVMDMVGEYYEFMGHAEVLRGADRTLSYKWLTLWKWYIGTFLGMIGGTVLAVMIPLIGLIVVLASTVGTLVISIVKIVYIYKTAGVFRNCQA
ncbi:MAG TPA: hypothetical protein H9697_06570 [Candidatus Mediterraneibacter faecavium]|uniref:Uncharacterized protein n=1 Tax=Candidatus Mediterraneibacter faecavium TaxID=2838668 RepID=A0A9D2QBV7_9FIRM|nr:hypothetical protein [Candidatus Mediterraneibacter faecavium]